MPPLTRFPPPPPPAGYSLFALGIGSLLLGYYTLIKWNRERRCGPLPRGFPRSLPGTFLRPRFSRFIPPPAIRLLRVSCPGLTLLSHPGAHRFWHPGIPHSAPQCSPEARDSPQPRCPAEL